jgi:hypothetical protein
VLSHLLAQADLAPLPSPHARSLLTAAKVHVVMYFYFFMCALEVYPPESWKKRITQLQLLQFACDLIFPISWIVCNFYITPGRCYGQEWFVPILILNESIGLAFIYLFYGFYKKAYGPGSAERRAEQARLRQERTARRQRQ